LRDQLRELLVILEAGDSHTGTLPRS
jgi:hypothetical protein